MDQQLCSLIGVKLMSPILKLLLDTNGVLQVT